MTQGLMLTHASISLPVDDIADRDPRIQLHRANFGDGSGIDAPQSFHRSQPRYDWGTGTYQDPFDGQHGAAAIAEWECPDPQWPGQFGGQFPPQDMSLADAHYVGAGFDPEQIVIVSEGAPMFGTDDPSEPMIGTTGTSGAGRIVGGNQSAKLYRVLDVGNPDAHPVWIPEEYLQISPAAPALVGRGGGGGGGGGGHGGGGGRGGGGFHGGGHGHGGHGFGRRGWGGGGWGGWGGWGWGWPWYGYGGYGYDYAPWVPWWNFWAPPPMPYGWW